MKHKSYRRMLYQLTGGAREAQGSVRPARAGIEDRAVTT
jgi:hypothetical protein